MTRVIVYEPTSLDLKEAEKFGDIQYMFTPQETRPSIWETEDFEDCCRRKLIALDFKPTEDYFAVAGPSVPLIVITNLLTRKYKEFRVLCWHAVIRDYTPRVFRGTLRC